MERFFASRLNALIDKTLKYVRILLKEVQLLYGQQK